MNKFGFASILSASLTRCISSTSSIMPFSTFCTPVLVLAHKILIPSCSRLISISKSDTLYPFVMSLSSSARENAVFPMEGLAPIRIKSPLESPLVAKSNCDHPVLMPTPSPFVAYAISTYSSVFCMISAGSAIPFVALSQDSSYSLSVSSPDTLEADVFFSSSMVSVHSLCIVLFLE